MEIFYILQREESGVGSIFFAFLFQQGVVRLREEWAHIFVQPLKPSIFQVKVLPQELPIYAKRQVRFQRTGRILSKVGSKKLVRLFRKGERPGWLIEGEIMHG